MKAEAEAEADAAMEPREETCVEGAGTSKILMFGPVVFPLPAELPPMLLLLPLLLPPAVEPCLRESAEKADIGEATLDAASEFVSEEKPEDERPRASWCCGPAEQGVVDADFGLVGEGAAIEVGGSEAGGGSVAVESREVVAPTLVVGPLCMFLCLLEREGGDWDWEGMSILLIKMKACDHGGIRGGLVGRLEG